MRAASGARCILATPLLFATGSIARIFVSLRRAILGDALSSTCTIRTLRCEPRAHYIALPVAALAASFALHAAANRAEVTIVSDVVGLLSYDGRGVLGDL